MAVLWMTLVCLLCLQLVSGEIENVALGKPTTASSLYRTSKSSNGVDGNKVTVDVDSLMHTDVNQPSAWWIVDLERDVVEAEVKIYFRTNFKYRRSGVQLYTSKTPFSTYPEGQMSHKVTGKADGTDIPDVVSVNCTGTWRYLMVYTETDNDGQGPILEFAEVEVLVCSDGTYDITCTKSCSSRHCADPSSPCDRYNALCVGGCDPGWIGNECTQECPNGKFGIDCTLTCGKCNGGQVCDHVTGDCPGECESGYRGRQCLDECPTSKYGAGCNSTCGQCYKGDTCHHVTGQCTRGCGTGWRGQLCLEACPHGTFGAGCNSTCGRCHEDEICDHVTGSCPVGCRAGWRGPVCNEPCEEGEYGAGCAGRCGHCKGSCDVMDGTCDQGCQEGYYGLQCTLQLPGETNVSHILISMAAGVVLSLSGVGLVSFCLLRKGRLMWMRTKKEEKSSTEMSSIKKEADERTHIEDPQSSSRHSGDLNSSSRHSGDLHSSSKHSGDLHSSSKYSGDLHSSSKHSGDLHSSSKYSGDLHSSSKHSGDLHSSSRHVYNNDYAVVNHDKADDKSTYDVIKDKECETSPYKNTP